MKILVVGASGLVGSHCMHVFMGSGYEVLGTHLNFATPETVFYNPSINSDENFKLESFAPDVIIHCGALTNVDYCETHEDESKFATVISARLIVDYCNLHLAKFVYISTDYVFNGENGPYTEDAQTNPINVYGKHKLAAEDIAKEVHNHLIVRITNVYGEEIRSKNFISRLILWLKNNEVKTLELPTDQFATPIYANDIANMLLALISNNKTGIYHLSSTDYYTRYHLAQRIRSYFPKNQSVNLQAVTTDYLNQPALRPLYGGLSNRKFLSEFSDIKLSNVDDFILKTINNDL